MAESIEIVACTEKLPKAMIGPSGRNLAPLLERLNESLHVKCHFEFLTWLQGGLQQSIPHQIFIAAWGDFSSGPVQHDVTSAIPGARTGLIADDDISRFTARLFRLWKKQGTRPFTVGLNGLDLSSERADGMEIEAFHSMRSVVVHGIRDARSRHDCLYAFLSTRPEVSKDTVESVRISLPFIDAALRQVAHLPCQFPDAPPMPEAVEVDVSDELGLTEREREIMCWVKAGKTNYETGVILNISTFTVKNHLQRIFRKLNATNRAQAVSSLKSPSAARVPDPSVLCRVPT